MEYLSRQRLTYGFTLVELMIVITILGILTSLAIPSYINYVKRARISSAVSTASNIKTAVGTSINLGEEKNDLDDASSVGLKKLPTGITISDGNIIIRPSKIDKQSPTGTITYKSTTNEGNIAWSCIYEGSGSDPLDSTNTPNDCSESNDGGDYSSLLEYILSLFQ